MNKLFDCFLYNDEEELLSTRLQLMASVVHKFVIACSRRTFTSATKPEAFPAHLVTSLGLNDKVDVIELDDLTGSNSVEREAFSRNALARGLRNADPGDVVLISDVDEFVRPATATVLAESLGDYRRLALGLDYYNFKFNYQMVHGEMAVWSGPVVCRMRSFLSAQELRNWRWRALDDECSYVPDAGWHFSFLTPNNDVRGKLDNYMHREPDIQDRGHSPVGSLIANRQGFFDHRHAGSVWAIVALNSLGCRQLEDQVAQYRELIIAEPPDAASDVNRRVRHAMRRVWTQEREKILWRYTWRELAREIGSKAHRKVSRAML